MQLNNLLRQGKADAGFSAPSHVKAIKYMREICLVNTISIVLYPDRHIPLVEAAGQTELAVGVPQTVGP